MKKILYTFILNLIVLNLFSQQITIKGKVTDGSTGEAIPGASILVEGTSNGVISNVDGVYSIIVASPDAILVCSFVGYVQAKQIIGSKSQVDFSLEAEVKALDEVVVVGYGTIKKNDLTGSVATVKTKDMSTSTSTSIDHMLQGRAAGLTLTSVSAQPGSRLDINIRGGTNPLYVIDGVPILTNPNPNNTNSNLRTSDPGINSTDLGFSGGVDRDPLNSINPSDIESIDILKDASAAAIYGSAAADGVILITTKKGKAGKISVEYRGSYSTQTAKDYFDLMNAQEFMTQHNRLQLEQYKLDTKIEPYGNIPFTVQPPLLFDSAQIADAGNGTDWLGVLMRDGKINEQNISISGGTEYTKVYTSFNYFGNDAILNNSTFNRYSGRINVDQQIGERIKTGANVTFSQINSNNASTGANSGGPEKYNMLQTAYVYSPTVPIYDSVGNFSRTFDPKITNPAAFLIINDYIRTNRFLVNPTVEVKILNDLKLNLVGGMDRNTSNRNFYLPRKALNVQLPLGMAQMMTSRIDNYSSEGYFTYNHQFSNSNLTIVGGAGYYKTISDGFSLQAVDFFTDAFLYYNVSVASNKERSLMNSYNNERTKISQFFRVNYSLFDKYILTLVGRNDASSIFAKNKKNGFFPGISGAWKINKESFMQGLSVFSDLKLRVGYGSAGNEGYIGNNPWQLYSAGYSFLIGSGDGKTNYTGVALSQKENPDITWETDITQNLGLDIGLLANRITASVDIFNKTKNDLIDYNPLPSNAAIGRIASNIGSQVSKGFEFSLNTNNLVGKFIWTTNITLSTYSLNWESRNPQVAFASWIKTKDPVYAIYGWQTAGIIKTSADTTGYVTGMAARPQLGQIKYVDVNKDGKLDGEDVVMLADGTPDWSFGFNNTFKYMGFDLNVYIYGLWGRKIPNGYRNFLGTSALKDNLIPSNTITDIKDVWSSDNLNGIYPGIAENSNPYNGANPTSNVNPYNAITNDFWLVDGSFARIKNITLGYTLPEKWMNSVFIKSARLYVDFQNIYVLTNYKGIDPEISDINPYPQVFSTSFGANIIF